MPLIVPNLETDIKKAFKAASKANGAKAEAILAKRLAIAIDKYIKSGIVTTVVAPGIVTAGSQYAQVTTTPGVGTGVIS